jgi:hypothetical protein
MIVEPLSPLERVLQALPFICQQRLLIMGWHKPLRDPERLLRRAIGYPQPVRLVDLETDPERWHGRYIRTTGYINWPERVGGSAGLGRFLLDTALVFARHPELVRRTDVRSPVTAVVLADPQVRAAHRAKHHGQGGYGERGLFIGALVVISLAPEGSLR